MNAQITVRTGQIGPVHDPYSTETVTVKANGRKAEFYSDGLGRRHLWLGDLNVHEVCVREDEWFDKGGNREKCQLTKANILFRRHVGLTVDEAVHEFERTWRPDPMGSLSDYI